MDMTAALCIITGTKVAHRLQIAVFFSLGDCVVSEVATHQQTRLRSSIIPISTSFVREGLRSQRAATNKAAIALPGIMGTLGLTPVMAGLSFTLAARQNIPSITEEVTFKPPSNCVGEKKEEENREGGEVREGRGGRGGGGGGEGDGKRRRRRWRGRGSGGEEEEEEGAEQKRKGEGVEEEEEYERGEGEEEGRRGRKRGGGEGEGDCHTIAHS